MSASAQAQPSASSPSRLETFVRQGMESIVSAQKILLDLTAQQNALVIGMVRERIRWPAMGSGSLVRLADKGVAGLTDAGKILLDFAAGETAVIVDGSKEALRLGRKTGAAAEVIRHRTNTLIEMHRRLLDGIAEQVHEAAQSYQEGKGLKTGTSLIDTARQAMERFVEIEKRFLDMTMDEVNAATEPCAEAEPHKPYRDRSKVLTQMAREGVDKYIEMQKKLAELAIQQFESGVKTAKERAEARAAKAEQATPVAELVRKSVKNFVNAQKMLLDAAVKPVKAAEEAESPAAESAPEAEAEHNTATSA